ncbi:N-6 DNA Methylase [Lentibacillus halodurans]|uniref:site-specific DNA-methyltransferase (adenine-specific) n=1 Tax=Lentibacillus halodurans TaxID=237679 RepID=A0A1I0WP30_9BACI|nr:TaqI-like C-terminal specificity domain-containing protein [Lentibacillus halodurans]SFA89920.1 N-6 DNA Methylase [Lentibacillus halodurans]
MPVKEFENKKGNVTARAFYQEYQKVRNALFTHLLEQNGQWRERVLVDKTQRIIDRVLFICFAENYKLIPQNVFRGIVETAQHTFNTDSTDLWEELKGLFRSIEKGHSEMVISQLNLKLFRKDDVLDQLVITDRIFPVFGTMTKFDFAADLDFSLLGYILEQSISDVEEMQAGMTGENYEPQQGKRKKNGIYYTSSGITRLLLQETLLNWIEDRKREVDERAAGEGSEQHTELNRMLLQQLKSVKILDPAAGSGAFLNTAYDLLKNQWDKVNKNTSETMPANVNIVTENLFGVELDENSLELAKLSLWLKTADKKTYWPLLDGNLKTGNAIIDQQVITERAFDWHQEFPAIMDDGGFDVIIGNPPYVFARNEGFTKAEKNYFNSYYDLTEYQINTYLLFIERSYYLLKQGGWLGFIVPNNLLTIDSCRKMRRFLLEQTGNLKMINIHHRMFEQADVDTCLLIFQKTEPTTVKLGEYVNEHVEIVAEVEPKVLLDEQSIINISLMKHKRVLDVMNKIENENLKLGTVATVKSGLVAYEVGRGTPPQTRFMKENRVYHSDCQVDDTYWMYLEGRDVCRYSIAWGGSWLKYGPNLAARRHEKIFTAPRILVRQIPSKLKYAINAVYTERKMLNDRNSNNIVDFQKDPLFLLGVINSKIITFWFIHKFDKFQRKTFPQFKVKDLKMFPVPDVSEKEMQQISEAVDQMLHVQRQKGETLHPTGRLIQKEQQLNEKIDRYAVAAFGLSAEEVQLIDAHLAEFLE